MSKLYLMLAALMGCLLLSTPSVEAKSTPKKATKVLEDPAVVQAKLDAFLFDYLDGCNVNSTACRTSPVLEPRDGKMVARYIEIDPKTLQTEIFPSPSPEFVYIAKISYIEHVFESEGSTKDEALNGHYRRVKSRKLIELPRYAKGKWTS